MRPARAGSAPPRSPLPLCCSRPRRPGADATTCGSWRRSMPMSPSRASATCSQAMPGSSRPAGRPLPGLAARSNGVDVTRTKLVVYVLTAFGTAMIGALIFLQKLRISPDTAFSVNDWTAFVIFITVIGGIGRVEGPIIGTVVFFVLRQTLADLGSLYLLMLGAVAIAVMLFAPKGIWGLIADRFGWQLLPLERRLRFTPDARTT